MTRWRLIEDGAADGPWNMGIDEALLRAAHDDGLPTLRLYRWNGPWLSLGYGQRRIPDTLREACEAAGVGIVRRTTGGGAVLHGADLTYSVAAPEACLVPGLRGSLSQIAEALLAAVHEVGVLAAARAPQLPRSSEPRDFDCFAVSAGDEICVAGRKLIGSAQRRRGGAILQHGSIRMAADSDAAIRASGLGFGPSTSLAEEGFADTQAVLRAALIECFARVLGIEFDRVTPDDDALREARLRCEMHAEDLTSAPRSRKPVQVGREVDLS